MSEQHKLIRIFTGSEVTALLIKSKLEKHGIDVLLKNDFRSGIAAGVPGSVPSAVDLYIDEAAKHEAAILLDEFNQHLPD